jgi:hypothetical protein
MAKQNSKKSRADDEAVTPERGPVVNAARYRGRWVVAHVCVVTLLPPNPDRILSKAKVFRLATATVARPQLFIPRMSQLLLSQRVVIYLRRRSVAYRQRAASFYVLHGSGGRNVPRTWSHLAFIGSGGILEFDPAQ